MGKARMYPSLIEEFDGPYSERIIYNALSNLSDDFVIFHSMNWVKKNKNKNFTWYENDYVILNRYLGILFLEIKGGKITFKNNLFYQENLETHEVNTINEGSDPLSQAKRGIFHFKYILEKNIPGITERLLVAPVIWFPSCIKDNKNKYSNDYREIYEAILDANNLDNVSRSLYSIYNDFYNSKNYTSISDTEFDKIISLFANDLDLVLSPSIYKNSLEDAFVRLTNEQSFLLDYISEQNFATIQGAAGTGKTLIAVEAARRFASEGRKVLFLCFNRFLYEHLNKYCKFDNVDYFNINKFVSAFTELDISSPLIRCSELYNIDINEIKYDDIIIDEAQDFENEEIDYFKIITNNDSNHLYIFYDRNQLVIAKKLPESIIKSECKLVLSRNCRNTEEIAKTSYNVIDLEFKNKGKKINGIQPTITFETVDSVKTLGKIIKYYKNNDNLYKDEDITILTLKTEETSILKGVKKIDGTEISNLKNNHSIFFTTARKFKGLESKVVIIIDIDESSFSDDLEKRIFYVACSRAKHRLSLLICGNDDKIKSIANSIGDFYGTSKGAIKQKTKTKSLKLN